MKPTAPPDALQNLAATYNSGHRTGALDAFGWAIEHLTRTGRSQPAAELRAEAVRRFGEASVDDELRVRNVAHSELDALTWPE